MNLWLPALSAYLNVLLGSIWELVSVVNATSGTDYAEAKPHGLLFSRAKQALEVLGSQSEVKTQGMQLCQPFRPLLSSSVLKWKVVSLVLHATEGLQHPEAFPGNLLSKMPQNLLNSVFDK